MSAQASPRIMLVDDDPAVRTSLKFALELEGFAVAAFASGEALLSELEVPDQSCLVLDYRLPGLSGLATLALLRDRGINVPAIIITSNPSRAIRQAVADAHATLIEKPLLCDALTSGIWSLVGSSESVISHSLGRD